MSRTLEGRAWVLDDDVDTDNLYPGFALKLPAEEAAKHVLYDLRPGWAEQVRPGDLLVAGKNFGIGSSRPVALLLRTLGIRALIAEEFNSLFLRNSVNYGLPALTAPGVREVVAEGDEIRLDARAGTVENLTTGARCDGHPLPDFVLDIADAGGLMAQLERDGYVEP